jgi:hypothetical protein
MRRLLIGIGLILAGLPAFGGTRYSEFGPPPNGSFGKVGDWIGSGGLGLTISPNLFLMSPQLEYVYMPNVYIGPLIQLAPGEGGVLISTSATIRTLLGKHPRVKPTVEAGLGFAVASSDFSSSAGVNIHFGMGVDYLLTSKISLGTMIRANFAPPMKTFYVSWPIFLGRFIL